MTGGVFAGKVKKKAQNPNYFSSDFAESGGDEGDRTLDLTDANSERVLICDHFYSFLFSFSNFYFAFKPLVTTVFHLFRHCLW